MKKENVLVIGGGAREAALIWRLGTSGRDIGLHCAPGNPGIAQTATCYPVKADDMEGLIQLARELQPDLTIAGPEAPLVAGISTYFKRAALPFIGPTAGAARLEGSKIYAKQFMVRHHIPTANFRTFDDARAASSYIRKRQYPLVIKANGLCAGKGVVVANEEKAALTAIEDMMVQRKFGDAGRAVVIEDCLIGRECSYIALVDGSASIIFPVATDYKRRYEGNKGPNTGGMGCYSPVPTFTTELDYFVREKILMPVIAGMQRDCTPYHGFLYIGLMLTEDGPQVLEFNVRMGDPEAAVILPLVQDNLFDFLLASTTIRGLDGLNPTWNPASAVCVVMTASDYPEGRNVGSIITGIHRAQDTGALVFHAGTAKRQDGNLETNGGRILSIVGVGRDLPEASSIAYTGVNCIDFAGMAYRSDIASKV